MYRTMNNIKPYIFAGLLAFFLLLTNSCDRNHNTTGWDYFPDMYYSNAYETYTENPNFPDQKTMREPVPGTVPREMIPFDYAKTIPDMERAGRDLTNPFHPTVENLERGKVAYERFCMDCHGEQGDGKGFLFTSNKYPYPPASLINDKMQQKPNGEIYHSITVGYGVMGAHGPLVRPDDRWKIILYIRNMQTRNNP